MTETAPRPIKEIVSNLNILRGIIPGEIKDANNEPYNIGQEEGGTWENVRDHMRMGSYITDTLATELHLPQQDRENVNLAFLIHDGSKKTERMWQRAIEERHRQFKGKPTSEILKKRKIAALKGVAAMEEWENAEAGIPPEVTKLAKANVPSLEDAEHGHRTDAEKIMWLADACLTGDRIDSIEERFYNLENDPKNGALNIAFSDSYRGQYNGRSLYNVQRELGQRYAQEFSQRIGIL